MDKIVLIVLSTLLASGIVAQDRLTPELLWKIDRISQDDISDDGETLVYGLSTYELEDNSGDRDLYLLSTNGGNPKLLSDLEGTEYNAQFRPNSDKIGFLYKGQLWEINRNGSERSQFSERKMTSFKYSPDGNSILFTAEVAYDTAVVYPDLPHASGKVIDDLMYRHWDHWEDGYRSNLFMAAMSDTGLVDEKNILAQPYDVPLQPFGGKEAYNWSADGQWVAYSCKKLSGMDYSVSTNSDIYLYHLPTGETTNLTSDLSGYDRAPVFSPDGSHIAWNSMARDGYESDRNRIFIQNLKNGTRKELTEGYDENANSPQFSKNGEKLFFLSGVEATIQLFSIPVDGGTPMQESKGRHNFYDFLVADSFVTLRKASMTSPHELYKLDLSNGIDSRLTFVTQKVMGKLEVGRVKSKTVETHDGKEMLVWTIYPPDFDPEKEYPTLLYCQGGPQAAVNQFFSYRWNFQLMAAKDFIIVAPNRRGLPSFGTEWNESISKNWGADAMQDYLTAIDDAIATEPAIDSQRVGAIGASFGGYSVYWLAGNHDGRFKSFISHCGLFNLESWYTTTEELFFANWDVGGPYWKDEWQDDYRAYSPHRFVGNWDTPILVIHGEQDFRVPVSEGIQAFHAAQIKGVKSRFLYFPDEGHWVLQPQNGVLWHREFFRWLEETLR